MYCETLIYGAEYFFTPRTYNNQTKCFEILLNGEFQKCILLPT